MIEQTPTDQRRLLEEAITQADIEAAGEAAYELAFEIVCNNHGAGNAAVLIDRFVAARIADLEAQVEQARIAGVRMGIEAAAATCLSGRIAAEGLRERSSGDADFHYGGMAAGFARAADGVRQLDPMQIVKESKA